MVLAVALILATAALFAVSPSFGIYEFHAVDYIGTIVFVALLLGLLWIQYQVRIEVHDWGIRVKNLVRSHELEWPELIAVEFGDGPWVRIDTTSGETISAMAIQSSDGEFARKEAVRLATLIDYHSTPEEND